MTPASKPSAAALRSAAPVSDALYAVNERGLDCAPIWGDDPAPIDTSSPHVTKIPPRLRLWNLNGAVLVPRSKQSGQGKPVIQGTWRGTRVTKFGQLDNSGHAQEGARAQQMAEA